MPKRNEICSQVVLVKYVRILAEVRVAGVDATI